MRPTKLPDSEIAARLGALQGWSLKQGKLFREFRFTDFGAAFAFMTRTALVAEKLDHHPEWFNVYNRVEVSLTTHDAHGVTELDFTLAQAMQDFAA